MVKTPIIDRALIKSPPVEESAVVDLERPHEISIVIPVYQGENTLATVVREISPLTHVSRTPDGYPFVVREVVLVNDNGPDDSARVMRELRSAQRFVRTVWLSRNFGQHATTLAGMASSGCEWVVTLDEDGQHDPSEIGGMLDTAMREQASVVYGRPVNRPPHGFLRNIASRSAKWVFSKLSSGSNASDYQSYRLMLGSIARSVAAYSGANVYLDVAIGWVADKIATSPITLREEGGRPSGYSLRRLFSHFWRMVLSSGTRALRVVSVVGTLVALVGVALAIFILIARLFGDTVPEGWASTIVVVLLGTGATLFSLGVIAEYIGVSVNMAMGKPAYLITSDPASGPLGRRRPGPR